MDRGIKNKEMKNPKQHLFLTGHPNVGKTTIITKVIGAIREGNTLGKANVHIRGFYTQEVRDSKGDRVGFDIVYWDSNLEEPKRTSLSRLSKTFKKSDPRVGKYLVNVQNVANAAVASLESSRDGDAAEVVIVDEIGKMEMLCPSFLPAVERALQTSGAKCIIVGTLPTPRYGRIIPAVEKIRSRKDVLVVGVTKDNRNELCKEVVCFVGSALAGRNDIAEDSLRKYVYSRPIGASTNKQTNSKEGTEEEESCGPLVSANVEPRVLVLGETASAVPTRLDLAYCERSLWIVLARMLGIVCKNIKDLSMASEDVIEQYKRSSQTILEKGISVWDVLNNVHVKGKNKGKRRRKNKQDRPNRIELFLKEHPSVQAIAFNGKNAYSAFLKYCVDEKDGTRTSTIKTFVLPSSSPSNTRMTVDQKALEWKQCLAPFIKAT